MKRVASAAVLLLVASCFSGYDSRKDGALRVHRGTFVQTLILTGELEAARGEVITVPRLPMWQSTIKWLANDGDAVKAGDRVVELDNTAFATDLDNKQQLATQASQELQQKEAEWSADLEQKQLDLEKRKSEYDKAVIEANVPREIVSQREYEDRQTKLHRSKTEYDKARAVLIAQKKAVADDRANTRLKLARAQRDVATAELAIDALVLRAGHDGVVVIRDHPWEGRKFQSGDPAFVGMALAQLPELESLQVTASLADVDDGRVTIGMPVTVTVDGYPSLHFAGTVSSISAVAREGNRNQQRRAFRVIVKLKSIDVQRMRPGLSTRVEIRRNTRPGVLLAPRAAIDFSESKTRARLAGGRVVAVKLGACNAFECIVESGLEDGQRLAGAAEGQVRG